MLDTKPMPSFASARELLKQSLSLTDLLEKLPLKDRINVDKRIVALEAEADPRHASLWQRLIASLMTLAPVVKLVGRQTMQFYIPDGRYRMQVFALEDLQDGKITVFCPNILPEAIEGGLLERTEGAVIHEHIIRSSSETLSIEPLDKNSPNAALHFKDLLGWNRKALRIALPISPTPSQIETTELLCAIAAVHFVHNPAPSKPGSPAHR